MAIPKIIYQTYKSDKLPFVTKAMTSLLRKKNPSYKYEFYDDERIDSFIKSSFSEEIYQTYARLDIGAAKADFFRYAVLYTYGGVYLDIDGYGTKSLDKFLSSDDEAVITMERNPGIYAQYALIFTAKHPILKMCIDIIVDNVKQYKHAHNVGDLTGPRVFTDAVNEYLKLEEQPMKVRVFGVDYNGYLKPKYWLHGGLFHKRSLMAGRFN